MGAYCWCTSVFVLVLCVSVFVNVCEMELVNGGNEGNAENDVSSICELNGCNCTAMHKYWSIVNCTFDSKRIINLRSSILPTNVIELSVIGGQELILHPQLFTTLKNFQRLRTDGTRTLLLKKYAFLNLTVNSLLVQLANCDSLVFETWAFKNMQGAVTTEISKCRVVTVQRSVFSFLQDATFQDISRLELAEEAFTMQTRPLGHHGAVTTIGFRTVQIPTIPRDAFKSTLAEVKLVGCDVGEVKSDAFSGYTISAIALVNSTIRRIHPRAFTDRTQLDNLLVTGCRIDQMDSEALLSATTNLTIQHSSISRMHTGAINATIAKTVLLNNEFGTIYSRGFSIHDWSRINIDNNLFEHLSTASFDIRYKQSQQDQELTFTSNELISLDNNSLGFIVEMLKNLSNCHIENNFFRYSCNCEMEKWLAEILGERHPNFSNNNYCLVDSTLAQCYDVSDGPANMKNFTAVFCEQGLVLKCKTFSADANVATDAKSDDSNHLILGLVLGLVFLVAVCGTVVILLIHGGLWLKRKGYCVRFSNFNYRAEEGSTEAEDIMVAVDKNVNEHLPDELTQELLHALREKLEDPQTYNEAREMIERLYDHFIVEDSYTNNNRQEEETHLYEELGNLPNPNADLDKATPTRPFSFLRLIEERFNLTAIDPAEGAKNSVLVAEYSEPTDAEIHLYSELPQSLRKGTQNQICDELISQEGSATQRSNGSGRMAYRPLPDKPKGPLINDPGEGPSTKF